MISITKVLFIMGKGRSGSTLLDVALGEAKGFFSAGEINNLWKRGILNGFQCGCRIPFSVCPVWSSILATMSPRPPLQQVLAWQKELIRWPNTRQLLEIPPDAVPGWPALEGYVGVLSGVYKAIAEVTRSRVVIDSSKRAVHGSILHLLPGISPYFVHLVRDPRAVAFSRQRTRFQGNREMRKDSAPRSAFTWARDNTLSEMVRRRHPSNRSLVVRYEDFVARPQPTLARILTMLGEATPELSFVDDNGLTLGVNHVVAGNPSRFKRGTVPLRLDDEWRTRQSRFDRILVSGLTFPLLRRYGYPLRVHAPSSSPLSAL